jgi:L-rhamnose mutarotase
MRFEAGAKLFHHVGILGGGVGYRAIHASRNYYGGLAIEHLIARFPNLNFLGSLHSDVGYDNYTLFRGHGGEAIFTEHVIRDFDARMKPVTTEQLREEIAKLDDKIANLQAERTDLSAYMERKGLPIYRRSVEEIVTDLKKNGAEFKSSGNA